MDQGNQARETFTWENTPKNEFSGSSDWDTFANPSTSEASKPEFIGWSAATMANHSDQKGEDATFGAAPATDDSTPEIVHNWGDNAASEHNQDADDQDNAASPTEATDEPAETSIPHKIQFVPERVLSLTTCVMIDNQVYSKPLQANLCHNDSLTSPTAMFKPRFNEPSLRSRITFAFNAKRMQDKRKTLPSEKHNPLNEAQFVLNVSIPACNIHNFTAKKAEGQPLPAEFGLQSSDPEAKDFFDSAGKFFLKFSASRLIITQSVIPKMEDQSTEATFKRLLSDLLRPRNSPIAFFAIVGNEDLEVGLFDTMKAKFESDSSADPIPKWIKDSPQALQINMGNILPAPLQPPLTEGFVAARRSDFEDPVEHHVLQVYALTAEHEYAKGCHAEWKLSPFDCVFFAGKGSEFPANEFDNALPKMALTYMSWADKKVVKPQPGDVLFAILPYDVPDCPEYTGPNAKPEYQYGEEVEAFNEDGTLAIEVDDDEGEEIIRPVGTASNELLAARDMERLKTWRGVVMPAGEELPPACVLVTFSRPEDFRFRGPKGSERRVDTVIPFINVESDGVEEIRNTISVALMTSPQRIMAEPTFSDQTFKDHIRCLNLFANAGRKDDYQSVAQSHLARFLLSFDDRIPFATMNFFDVFTQPNCMPIFKTMSDNQQNAVKAGLKTIKHGYVGIQGCVASGKSRISMKIFAMALANPVANFKGLIVSDTNAAADEHALSMQQLCDEHGIKNKKIIRVGAMNIEHARFTSHRLPKSFREDFKPELEETLRFLSQKIMYDRAMAAEKTRRAGDKRFTAATQNLALHVAMNDMMYSDKTKYANLLQIINHIEKNPNDSANKDKMPELNEERKKLMVDTLQSADLISTTVGQAIRSYLSAAVPFFDIIIMDEGAKRCSASTAAIIGAFTFKLIIDNGDIRQLLTYFATADNPEFWNPFYQICTHSILHRAIESDFAAIYLNEQHRLFTPALSEWLSSTYYGGMMIDANAKESPNLLKTLVTTIMNDQFGINNNFGMVVVAGSRHEKEEAGTSLYNEAIQEVALDFLSVLDATAAANGIQERLTACIISPYKADIAMVEPRCFKFQHISCQAFVAEVVQGLDRMVVVLMIPNATALTKFAADRRRLLVELTRHRYGLLVIVTEEVLDHQTYKFASAVDLLKSPFGVLKSLSLMATDVNALKHIGEKAEIICRGCEKPGHKKQDCPESALVCFKCQQPGHAKADCPVPNDACFNCLETGHKFSDCPAPQRERTRAQTATPFCKRCKQNTHVKDEIPGCNACGTCDHDGKENCPKNVCKICHEVGTHQASKCSKRNACMRCGGDHSIRYCQVKHNRSTYSSARPVLAPGHIDTAFKPTPASEPSSGPAPSSTVTEPTTATGWVPPHLRGINQAQVFNSAPTILGEATQPPALAPGADAQSAPSSAASGWVPPHLRGIDQAVQNKAPKLDPKGAWI